MRETRKSGRRREEKVGRDRRKLEKRKKQEDNKIEQINKTCKYVHLVTNLVIYGFQLITVKLMRVLPIFLFPVTSPIPLFSKAYFLVLGFHFPKCF